MPTKLTKLKARLGAKAAAVLTGVAGKKARAKLANRLAVAGDAALVKVTAAARKRQRARTLKKVGKAVMAVGAAAATVAAGRAIIKRRKA